MKNFIIWPSRATEVYTEQLPKVKQRVLMYSDYKHHQTVKFLVGCAPNGVIPKCYGGRSSDSYITNDCSIVDLIEPGDVVLS